MPKDKGSIKGFATAREVEEEKYLKEKYGHVVNGLSQIIKRTAADYSAEEEKAEPQDESVINCYYFAADEKCPGAMGDERHYVIKNGNVVMAHKRCHKRDQDGEKKTPNVMIR